MPDFSQIPALAARGAFWLVAGTFLQFILLTHFHRTRPWFVAGLRTMVVQVCALMAAGLLVAKWPIQMDHYAGPVFLPMAIVELFVVLWYLIWPRTYRI